MENLKKQQEKLLASEIAQKTMEYMLGLNEESELWMKKKIKKASRRLVKMYSSAIDEQYKEAAKKLKKENKKQAEVNDQVNITDEGIVITTVPEEFTTALAS